MNLNDERNYQMRQEVLDVMSLSEGNRRLAEEYLDTDQPENRMLLEKASREDFSKLSKESLGKCISYLEHLRKRDRTEDYARYIRFSAAVGGSTARHVLFTHWYNNIFYRSNDVINAIRECLTLEQQFAIQAEMLTEVLNNLNLGGMPFKELLNAGGNNLQAVRGAMEISRVNAKMLLASIYLYHTKPSNSQKGILKGLFSKPEKENTEMESIVTFLLGCMIAGAGDMVDSGQALTGSDRNALKDFLQRADANAPFTGDIQKILNKGGMPSEYLVRLIAGCAFLAIEHSDRFLLILRLAVNRNLDAALHTCKNMCVNTWFFGHLELLEQSLPVLPEEYGRWCMVNQIDPPLHRMAMSDPAVIERLLSSAKTAQYQYLLGQVEKVNPSLYQKLNAGYSENFRLKMAQELSEVYGRQSAAGQSEAMNYLLGTGSLESLYPFVSTWRDNIWRYTNSDNYMKMVRLRDGKDVAIFRRAVVLEALGCRTNFFTSLQVYDAQSGAFASDNISPNSGFYAYQKKPEPVKQVTAMLDVFEAEGLPVSYQLETFEAVYNSYYSESSKNQFTDGLVKVLAQKRETWGDELVNYAQNGSAVIRYVCIRVLECFRDEYKETLLSCASDSSKLVREQLITVYANHRDWEPEILNMLASKKSQEREMAIQVLGKWGADKYQEQLEKACEVEKSKKIKDQILLLLGKEVSSEAAGRKEQAKPVTTDQLAKELLKGNKRRKVDWIDETVLLPVHKPDGSEASSDHLLAILAAYADMGTLGVNKDAVGLASELDPKELATFMNRVFDKWMETGAEAKKKWVLYAASIHGGDVIVPVLHHQIQVWPEASRGAIAAEAVRALALNGTSTSLLLVDQISRKFKNRQVKAAAGEALTYAAAQLGITRMELEDRIVPSLGFDDKMERHFDYGSRSFRVRLTSALELEIFDESGKKLKNMPSPGKQDDEEKAKAASDDFKMMKKQLKTVVTNQKSRLEQALSSERLWQAGKWQALFVKNPIMHQFAIGLIWGVYDRPEMSGGSEVSDAVGVGMELKTTFRYMEDGSFNTVDEEEYELPEGGLIGLVHPVELSGEILAAWKEQLSDYEVTQPFDQLERTVYRITEEEKKEKELTRFGGVVLNGMSLSGKLLGQGWYRGPIEDAGFYCSYYRNDGANGVELEFSGASVGYEVEDVTVYGVYFYPSGEAAQGNYRYQKDYDKKRCLLSEVSPRYFSEIVLLVTKATASSQEKLNYPECKKHQWS